MYTPLSVDSIVCFFQSISKACVHFCAHVCAFFCFVVAVAQVKIPSCTLYHYDVSIVPDKCPRRVNREIIEELVKVNADQFAHHKPVFDGRKNLYSRKLLPIGKDRVSTSVNE